MPSSPPHWLVTGASGQLGGHVCAELAAHASPNRVTRLTRRPVQPERDADVMFCDLADPPAICERLRNLQITHIVHLAAVTAVGDAHGNPAYAHRVNTDATRALAEWAADHAARMVFASTDMVFDGDHAPYHADDPPAPLSQYGRTKAAAEAAIAGMPGTLTVRLPLMYGFPVDERSTTFTKQIAALRAHHPLTLFTDEFRTPISLRDAARALIALALSNQSGVIHVAGPERLSRFAMVERFAAALAIPAPNLSPASRLSIASPEPRPADLSLDGHRFNELYPDLAPQSIGSVTLGAR